MLSKQAVAISCVGLLALNMYAFGSYFSGKANNADVKAQVAKMETKLNQRKKVTPKTIKKTVPAVYTKMMQTANQIKPSLQTIINYSFTPSTYKSHSQFYNYDSKTQSAIDKLRQFMPSLTNGWDPTTTPWSGYSNTTMSFLPGTSDSMGHYNAVMIFRNSDNTVTDSVTMQYNPDTNQFTNLQLYRSEASANNYSQFIRKYSPGDGLDSFDKKTRAQIVKGQTQLLEQQDKANQASQLKQDKTSHSSQASASNNSSSSSSSTAQSSSQSTSGGGQ